MYSLPDSYINLIITFEPAADELTVRHFVWRLLHEEHKWEGDISVSDSTEKQWCQVKGKQRIRLKLRAMVVYHVLRRRLNGILVAYKDSLSVSK